ncbi:hypothetical protein ALC60_06609 [Trachymyrmex zeteki]|uniref:Uncharacterized protein n=1 Tax=Mycetomoellerius zeteki TaxID=64791 RepID=A0A151X209_9HYME|nr:hypothetical protein ALC60_06609 [Trachymyrmex zeteki]
MEVPSSLTTSATILFPRERGGSTAIPPLSCSIVSGGAASLAAPPTRATFNTSTKSLVRFLLSISSMTSCVLVFSSSRPPDSYRRAIKLSSIRPVLVQVTDKNLDQSYDSRYLTYGSIGHELYSGMIAFEPEKCLRPGPFHYYWIICGVAGFRYTGLPLSLSAATKPPLAARSGSSGIEHRLTTLSIVQIHIMRSLRLRLAGSSNMFSTGGLSSPTNCISSSGPSNHSVPSAMNLLDASPITSVTNRVCLS